VQLMCHRATADCGSLWRMRLRAPPPPASNGPGIAAQHSRRVRCIHTIQAASATCFVIYCVRKKMQSRARPGTATRATASCTEPARPRQLSLTSVSGSSPHMCGTGGGDGPHRECIARAGRGSFARPSCSYTRHPTARRARQRRETESRERGASGPPLGVQPVLCERVPGCDARRCRSARALALRRTSGRGAQSLSRRRGR